MMSHSRLTLSQVFALAIWLAGSTCPSAADFAAQDYEADHDALRKIRAVAEEAINTNNLDLFKPHLADDFTIVTYTDREFSDFTAFKVRWQKTRDELLDGGTYTTDMQPELSQIIGDIAIARGNSQNILINGSGERFEFPSKWTAVLQKVDGEWKVVRAHSSLSPFDNPMLRSAVKGMMIKMGIGMSIAGLVLGWLTSWLACRFRRKTPQPVAAEE